MSIQTCKNALLHGVCSKVGKGEEGTAETSQTTEQGGEGHAVKRLFGENREIPGKSGNLKS
jgi:hypothetical protein